jgi:methyltransferase (TIGR00027 family)
MNSGAPSRTAEYMALFRALESVKPAGQRLFDDPDASRFLRPTLRVVVNGAKLPGVGSMIAKFIDHRWPGPRPSGVVRTRLIDDFLQRAVGDGCTQLLLLGAGYDTRARRLAAAASTTVFEVDHPSTQARKRKALGPAGENTRENIHYIPLDFERDALPPALQLAGFDTAQRSCVVWEGVFSYLTPEAIDLTLASLVEVCAPRSQVVLTYVDQGALDQPGSQPQAWLTAVQDVGEPFQTGLHPDQAAEFFAARHLSLQQDESTAEAARRLGVDKWMPGFYRLAMLTVN